jgi:hypothetical protein
MDGRVRNRRLPAAVFLLLCVAPPCAEAQQFVCWPIVRGDTVARLARQLTGNPGAVYTHAFQIRDPARQMFLPKSQYRRPLSTQWEACVATGPVRAPLASAPIIASAATPVVAPEPTITSTPLAITPAPLAVTSAPTVLAPSGGLPDGFVFTALIGSAVVLMLLIGAAVGGSLTPRPIPPLLQRAGEEFVVAFARPLIDSSSDVPPIQARMRFIRHAQRLEISIAPGAGRRYPNLVDHKRNVEYDVTRVMRGLGTHVVVSDRLRAAGKWVVVPIRLSQPAVAAISGSAQRRLADLKQTGAK